MCLAFTMFSFFILAVILANFLVDIKMILGYFFGAPLFLAVYHLIKAQAAHIFFIINFEQVLL